MHVRDWDGGESGSKYEQKEDADDELGLHRNLALCQKLFTRALATPTERFVNHLQTVYACFISISCLTVRETIYMLR